MCTMAVPVVYFIVTRFAILFGAGIGTRYGVCYLAKYVVRYRYT